MKIDNRNNMMSAALRCGLSLFVLSGTCVLSAQAQETAKKDIATMPKQAAMQQSKRPTYEMKEVKGVVYDAATKAPLAGVRVQALNNRFYTTLTDEKGAYILKVPTHITALYVSVEGYNGVQIGLREQASVDAYLFSDNLKPLYTNGTEVLQTANLAPKTSSAISLENEVEHTLNSTVRTISRGGLPAQGATFFINGLNSLNANAQPLVVVDGVIWDMQYDRGTIHEGFFNNVFNLIDVEDIENIEVLRNGTALYGSEGANGVLKITTKRGKSLATRINIRAYGGVEQAPTTLPMMNAAQYRNYLTEFLGTRADIKRLASSMEIPFLNEDKNYLYYKQYHNDTDWQKNLYRTALTQNYRVGVQGGDDVAMYNLSLGFTQGEATAKDNDFNRLNIRFNTDVHLAKSFTTQLDIAYVRNAYNLRDNGWAESYAKKNISSPNVLGAIQSPFVDPYAYYITYLGNNRLGMGHTDKILTGMNYLIDPTLSASHRINQTANPFLFASEFGYEGLANPYWILKNGQGDNKNFQEQTQFLLNIAPKYQFTPYLSVTNRFSYVLNRSNEKYFMPRSGTPIKPVKGLGNVQGVVSSQFSKETVLFNDFRINWKRNYGAHDWEVFGGFRMGSYGYSNSYVGGYNHSNDKMPNLAYSLQYLDYGGNNDRWVNLSYYANVDYNYKNRYFLKLIASTEASSRFGKQAEDGIKVAGVKWGLFPSLQGAWVVSNESWFSPSFIDYLKISGGYEASGNDNVDYYAARTYFHNVKFLDRATALELANIQNPKIQWETTHRFNLGAQINLLRNRLSLGVDVYRSLTTNLLTRKTVSDVTGLALMLANEGEMSNTGFNVMANAVLVNTKNWKWQLGATLGHYKNEITALPATSNNRIELYPLNEKGQKELDKVKVISGYTTSIYGDQNVLTATGHAAGVFYGYQTKGVFASSAEAQKAHEGKASLKYPTGLASQPSRDFRAGDIHFVDQNGDGWISEADKVVIGDPNPDFFGNFFTTLSWKRFTLDLNVKYSLGGDIYNYNRRQLESVNNIWNQTTAVVNRWRYEGQQTSVPRAMDVSSMQWVNNERFSDRWVEDGSYLKLKKVRLSYELPLSLSWLQGLSVWGEANNVVTLSKYLGADPEVSVGNSVLVQGIDAGFLPQSRNFNLGVTINL